MGFMVAIESALRLERTLVPGSPLSLQALLLHGSLDYLKFLCMLMWY